MLGDGCGPEKFNPMDIRMQREPSVNNNHIQTNGGMFDKNIGGDGPDSEDAQREITNRDRDELNLNNNDNQTVDTSALRYQGVEIDKISQFNETFPYLLETWKSFTRACDETRMNLANRVCYLLGLICDEFNVSHDLRGPFFEGYATDEDRIEALHKFRDKILVVLEQENVYESLFYPGGKDIHLKHQKDLRDTFNNEHPDHNHNDNVVTMEMIKRLVGKGQIGRAAKTMSQRNPPVVKPDNFPDKVVTLSSEELSKMEEMGVANSKLDDSVFHQYEELDELNFVGPDIEDISRIVSTMDIGCAKGVSGFSNKILKTFCANRDPKGLELITYLVNFILRGWVCDKDWDLINTTRGISLDKGNFKNDSNDWRPICIRNL